MKIVTLPGVYPPSEDTYFLAHWLESLPLRGKYLLDMGTGSGYLAVLGALKGARVLAVDIQPQAVLNARMNARINGVRVRTILSDLFENVRGIFDVIVFNPPYLSPWEDARDPAWDGGWRIIRSFLEEVHDHLSPGGCFGFVMEEDENWRKIRKFIDERFTVKKNAYHLVRVTSCP